MRIRKVKTKPVNDNRAIPPGAVPVKNDWPWEKPLPPKTENGRKMGTLVKMVPELPGPRAACPLCGRMVHTTRGHIYRYYGSENSPPADEWDTEIVYECPTKEEFPGENKLTIYHQGRKKFLTPDEIAKTYERHYT